MAPKLAAVPMAARPATPAPATNTLAGGTLPAAVTWPLKKRPKALAASTTARTLATRFSPANVSRGTAISWDIGWGGILAWQPGNPLLRELEAALHDERERGGGNRAGQQRHVVVQGEPRSDALAVAARA